VTKPGIRAAIAAVGPAPTGRARDYLDASIVPRSRAMVRPRRQPRAPRRAPPAEGDRRRDCYFGVLSRGEGAGPHKARLTRMNRDGDGVSPMANPKPEVPRPGGEAAPYVRIIGDRPLRLPNQINKGAGLPRGNLPRGALGTCAREIHRADEDGGGQGDRRGIITEAKRREDYIISLGVQSECRRRGLRRRGAAAGRNGRTGEPDGEFETRAVGFAEYRDS